MRFLRWLSQRNHNMIDMIGVAALVTCLKNEDYLVAILLIVMLPYVSIFMEKKYGR